MPAHNPQVVTDTIWSTVAVGLRIVPGMAR
jgi:hypothetical protein